MTNQAVSCLLILSINTHIVQTPNFFFRVKESARLQQVLKDSRFQADPFAAIYNHLQATMPDPGRMPKASKVSQVSKKTKK